MRLFQGKWFYQFAVWTFRAWARLFFGLRVTGQENVPREGALVVACNHFSSMDPPVVGVSVPREIHFMAKRELFEKPGLRLLMLGLRTFPVNRDGNDTGAIRTGLRKLARGMAVGVFIQGTRTAGDKTALGGASFLALRSGAPLLPTAVWREGRSYRVHFGEPMPVAGLGLAPEEVTRLLSIRINEFLPEDKHVYVAP